MLSYISKRNMCNKSIWKPPIGAYTGIKVYNCVAKQKVAVTLPNENFCTWYTCGPTVYDRAHLGHASCYVKLDIIQRILKNYFKINLVTAMNITDIDDKIITKSLQTNKNWKNIALDYEKEFFNDLRKLNVQEPNIKIRVTENMDCIINFIKQIIEKGMAYCTKDGSVYFNVKKYSNYGKLQNINMNENYSKILTNEKCNIEDFALWKSKKFENEPTWQSPWGEGRPGWHIECSAIASSLFGSSIDFHAGGIDLRFPHHENEEAQSCVFHESKQWINYWLHTGHLHIKGDENKMSKSLMNTITIDEMLKKYESDHFRMACLLSNYKNNMEYSDEMMETAANTLKKFKSFKSDCLAYIRGVKPHVNLNSDVITQNISYTTQEVNNGLCDDFNTAYTISVLLDQVSSISRSINNSSEVDFVGASCLDVIGAAYNLVQNTLDMYGISIAGKYQLSNNIQKEIINVENLISGIIETRSNLRHRAISDKNPTLLKVCDEIRKSLNNYGIEIKDHSKGSTWEYIKKTIN